MNNLKFEEEFSLLERMYSDGRIDLQELDFLPGWLHINNTEDFSLVWMNKTMQNEIQATNEQVLKEGLAFMNKIIHPATTKVALPLLSNFIKTSDNDSVLGFFQYIKPCHEKDYKLYATFTKFLQNQDALISFSIPIEVFGETSKLVEKIVQENLLIKNENRVLKSNLSLFSKLTIREKEILQYVISGLDSKTISEKLNISKYTVDTHRKRICKKLHIRKPVELTRFECFFN